MNTTKAKAKAVADLRAFIIDVLVDTIANDESISPNNRFELSREIRNIQDKIKYNNANGKTELLSAINDFADKTGTIGGFRFASARKAFLNVFIVTID